MKKIRLFTIISLAALLLSTAMPVPARAGSLPSLLGGNTSDRPIEKPDLNYPDHNWESDSASMEIDTPDVAPGIKYVHYSAVLQIDGASWPQGAAFSIVEGTLPAGVVLKPDGELYGIPKASGDFTFTVRARYQGVLTAPRKFTMHIRENTDEAVWSAADRGYELTTVIPNEDGTVTIDAMDLGNNSFGQDTQLMVSKGRFDDFVELALDGQPLEEGTDYTKEPGSTRLTLQTQTLKKKGKGTHTLSAEFRSGRSEHKELKRAAQNYTVTSGPSGSSTGSGGSTGSTSGTSGSAGFAFADVSRNAWFYQDVKWAYESGLMNGVSTLRFSPAEPVGQGTVVSVLSRMAQADLSRFSADGYDNIAPGQWYTSAAVWATQAGLLPDESVFQEDGPISRGDMAVMLVKYLRSMGVDTSLPASPPDFADAWEMSSENRDAFHVLRGMGIFQGTGTGRMDPAGVTSRCEFSALMHRLDAQLP